MRLPVFLAFVFSVVLYADGFLLGADKAETAKTSTASVTAGVSSVNTEADLSDVGQGNDDRSFIEKIGDYTIFDYKVWRLGFALCIVLVALAINTVIRFILKKRQNKADAEEGGKEKSTLGKIIESSYLPLRIVVWGGAIRLTGPVLLVPESDVVWLAQMFFSVAAAVYIYKLVDVLEYYLVKLAEKTDNKLDDMLVPLIRKSLKILVIIIAGLHLYNSATGQPITTLLAGLGLGGLAFALAAQDTLKNIFGFIMILADRPFIIGERIDLCGHDGEVESIGFRSVRIRRLDGHLVAIPNSKAADEVIHNIARRPFIKRVMNITITYDTPLEKVEKAIEIVRDILKDHEGMNPELPPQVYFNELNADSLNILALYWYHPPAYWDYLAHAQKVNLELMKRFEDEGIEFAFPTQTLYLAGDPNRDLVVKGLEKGM
jgi:MscS family membrane protein